MANTKLTPEQKSLRKMYLQDAKFQGVKVANVDDKTVMAYRVRGNTVEFALSVMSPDEKKFRAKVGEFFALDRFFNGHTVKMDFHNFMVMTELVWDAYLIED